MADATRTRVLADTTVTFENRISLFGHVEKMNERLAKKTFEVRKSGKNARRRQCTLENTISVILEEM